MSQQSPKHKEAVIKYYDDTRAEYRLIWRSNHNLGLHFGYYDENHQSHDAAITNINAKLAEFAHIIAADNVLDAGCGVGGSAIWLAEHIGCNTTGINLVPLQIQKAKHYANEHRVSDLVKFKVADFAATGFKDQTFTVIWGLESIVHAEDKQAVFDEAYRTLKPGGRLIIAEYLLKPEPLNNKEQLLLDNWLAGWAMPSLMTEAQYQTIAHHAGFKITAAEDWTAQVMPSLMRIKRFATFLRPLSPLMRRLKIINDSQVGNRSATQAQMELLHLNVWRYKVLLFTK